MKKIFNVVISVLCACFAVILVINTTLIAKSLLNEDTIPDVIGYFPLVVLSDSMYPTFESGDLVIYHKVSAQDVSEGDIIVFYDPADASRQTLVTHRVVEIVTENGENKYRTKGDANNTEDQNLVTTDDIVGLYRNRISGAGNIALFMQTTKGMLVCVVLPLCLFVLLDGIGKGKPEKEKVQTQE
jgi:signal peptidase